MRKNINQYHFTEGLTDAITTLPGIVKAKQTELQQLKQSKADPDAVERIRNELSQLNHRLVDAWIEFGSEAKAWHISTDLDLTADDDASSSTKLSRYDINRLKRVSEHPSIARLACRDSSSHDKGIMINAIVRRINVATTKKKKNRNEGYIDVYGDGMTEDIAWVLLNQSLIDYNLTMGNPLEEYVFDIESWTDNAEN